MKHTQDISCIDASIVARCNIEGRTTMRTHLGYALFNERKLLDMTQDAVADRLGISRPALNLLENRQRRPDAETLPLLCHGWPDPNAGVRVAIEHLRDEWDRCGLPTGGVSIRAADDDTLEHATAQLRAIRIYDAELYSHLIALMDAVVAASGGSANERLLAADGGPTWDAKPRKDRKKKT
jgi:transcriptional regulator with XRE-family HTH domain